MTITTSLDVATIVDEYIASVDAGHVAIADSLRSHTANDIAAVRGISHAEAEDAFERLVEAAHGSSTTRIG